MSVQRQRGFSLATAVMIILTISLMLMSSMGQRLSVQLRIDEDEKNTIQQYSQAMSSLHWGMLQHWPMPGSDWFCRQDTQRNYGACLKLSSLPPVALLKSTGADGSAITLYRLVDMEYRRDPVNPNRQQVELKKRLYGWLDYCLDVSEGC
jgi:hypothetical protein